MVAVAGRCALIAKYFPAMVGETEFDAIAVRTCNPPPAGPCKTRNQRPLGRFQHRTVRMLKTSRRALPIRRLAGLGEEDWGLSRISSDGTQILPPPPGVLSHGLRAALA